MKYVLLDGEKITDRNLLHETLKEQLELPDWYGNNLDALADCLTEPDMEADITLVNLPAMMENLGVYGERFLKVMNYLQEENENIFLNFEEE